MLKEQFEEILAEFGGNVKRPLALDDDGTVTFAVDDEIIINIQYLEESESVVAFAPIGGLGNKDKPDAGERALELLRLNELGGLAEGFTLALDEEADLVLAMDRRSALEFASTDSFAAWIEVLVRVVHTVRDRFAERFTTEGEG